MPRFRNQTYQYFDVCEKDKSAIAHELAPVTTRLLLYGSYSVIDCSTDLLDAAYDRIEFGNNVQHYVQTRNVGANPVINFNNPKNPWNLIYIAVYSDKHELVPTSAPAIPPSRPAFVSTSPRTRSSHRPA